MSEFKKQICKDKSQPVCRKLLQGSCISPWQNTMRLGQHESSPSVAAGFEYNAMSLSHFILHHSSDLSLAIQSAKNNPPPSRPPCHLPELGLPKLPDETRAELAHTNETYRDFPKLVRSDFGTDRAQRPTHRCSRR